MKINFLIIPFLALSIAFVSCNGNSENQKNQGLGDGLDSTASADTFAVDEDNDVAYNLPSALQVAFVFKKSGAGFLQDLPNNKNSYSKYNTSNYKRATNFGIYSADLAYCLFNKKYQDSKDYLKSCREVGSFLGLNQVFESDNMAQRFDKNIASEDSLIKIISNVQLKTDAMFQQNKQKHITALAFAGAWTESVYIAAEVYAKEKNKKVLASLMEQLFLSETIIKALKVYQTSEPELPSLISSIEKINLQINSIDSVKASIDKDEELDFGAISITDNELKNIVEIVKTLRTDMIN